MDIKGKNNLILAKIFSNKNAKILSVFLVVFLFSFVFVNDANALLDGIAKLLFNVISAFFESLAYIAVMISKVFVIIFSSVIQGTGAFANSSAVDVVWTFVRDLVNMSFIIAMLIAAIYKMIGKESSLKAKKFSTQIIYILIGAFIINFSKAILGAFIDITNLISMIFVNSYKDSINNVFNNFFYFSTVTGAARNMLESILLFVFGLGLFAYCATLLLYGVIRMGILTISTMLSPLLIFSFFFPKKIDFIDKLNIKKQFFSFSFGGITVTFFLWICLMILSAGGTSQLDNAIFGTSDAETIKGITNEDVAGGSVTSSDFWDGALLKIVAVAILLLGQKTAMDMAKEAGFGAEKFVGNIADKVNTFGMAPLNFAKTSLTNTADYGKFLGSKVKDSAVGGVLSWMTSNRNSLSNKAIMAADKLRENKEKRDSYMSDRAKVMKGATSLKGIEEKRKFMQDRNKETVEAIGEGVVAATDRYNTVKKGVSGFMNRTAKVQEFKNRRESFVADKVMDTLNNVDRNEFSVENVNENFTNALFSVDPGYETNIRKISEEQNISINEAAKKFYDSLSKDKQEDVKAMLTHKYNREVSDRQEKLQEIRSAYDSGDVESGNNLAMDIYNSGTFGVNKSDIDRSYNSELEKLRGDGAQKEKLSKEERRIQSFERQKEDIKRRIKLGEKGYTDKDIDVLDAKIVEQKKRILTKQVEQDLINKAKILKNKQSMSEGEIDSLISRDRRYKELGGDATLASLQNDIKSIINDDDYLSGQSNEETINTVLFGSGSFEEKLNIMKNSGGMSEGVANWIASKKAANSNITLDELKKANGEELKSLQDGSSYLNDNSNTNLTEDLLKLNGVEFDNGLQDAIKKGKMSEGVANWIASKKAANSNITLDELKKANGEELKSLQDGSSYLNDNSNINLTEDLLKLNGVEFDNGLQDAIKKGKMSEGVANWIASKKAANSNITLDELKKANGEELKSLQDGSSYLNDNSNINPIKDLLGSVSGDFESRLQQTVDSGKISQNLANWIASQKASDEDVDLNKLRKNKQQELSAARAKTSDMEDLKLNKEEKDIVDISYKKIQDARKDSSDAYKAVDKQEDKIFASRQAAAGVLKEDRSERWSGIKDIQSKLKDTYVDASGKFDKDFGLTSFFNAEKLRDGKYVLSGSKDEFVAALALKISSGGKLTEREEQMLNDDGVVKMVMDYVNSGNDNVFREGWNKQIEKSNNSSFISRFRTNIIDSKPKVKSFEDRQKEEAESYSGESIRNRAVEYLSSGNINNYIDKKTGTLREDRLQSDLEKKFGILDFSNQELLQKLFQEATARSKDVVAIKNYSGNGDVYDIAESIKSMKNMYQLSRRPEYLAMANTQGIKDKAEIEKYVERMAYKDVMEMFNLSTIGSKQSGIGKSISNEMARYKYDENDKNALLDTFIKVSKVTYGEPAYKYNTDEIKQEFDRIQSAIKSGGSGLTQKDSDLIEREFGNIVQSMSNLQSNLLSNYDSKKIVDVINSIQNSVNSVNGLLKSSSSTSNVDTSGILKSIESKLSDLKFTINLSDNTSKVQTSAGNDAKKQFELNNKVMRQLRRLLKGINPDASRGTATIESSLKIFSQGISGKNQAFLDILNDVSKKIDKGSEDQNIAYKYILDSAVASTNDILLLKQLLRNIDRKQIELRNKIETRIKNINSKNEF